MRISASNLARFLNPWPTGGGGDGAAGVLAHRLAGSESAAPISIECRGVTVTAVPDLATQSAIEELKMMAPPAHPWESRAAAQLRLTAAVYVEHHQLDAITCRLVYINSEGETVAEYEQDATAAELRAFLTESVQRYRNWADSVTKYQSNLIPNPAPPIPAVNDHAMMVPRVLLGESVTAAVRLAHLIERGCGGWNQSKLAKELGISRNGLKPRLEKCGVEIVSGVVRWKSQLELPLQCNQNHHQPTPNKQSPIAASIPSAKPMQSNRAIPFIYTRVEGLPNPDPKERPALQVARWMSEVWLTKHWGYRGQSSLEHIAQLLDRHVGEADLSEFVAATMVQIEHNRERGLAGTGYVMGPERWIRGKDDEPQPWRGRVPDPVVEDGGGCDGDEGGTGDGEAARCGGVEGAIAEVREVVKASDVAEVALFVEAKRRRKLAAVEARELDKQLPEFAGALERLRETMEFNGFDDQVGAVKEMELGVDGVLSMVELDRLKVRAIEVADEVRPDGVEPPDDSGSGWWIGWIGKLRDNGVRVAEYYSGEAPPDPKLGDEFMKSMKFVVDGWVRYIKSVVPLPGGALRVIVSDGCAADWVEEMAVDYWNRGPVVVEVMEEAA